MSAPMHAPLRADADPARAPRPPRLDDARAAIRRALAEGPGEGVLSVTVSAPVAPIEAPLRAARKGASWAFAGESLCVVGLGVTRSESVSGDERLLAARDACVRLLSGCVSWVEEGALAIPLRAFVGLAFAPGSADAPPWDAFGDGVVALPRWTYACDRARASLTLAIDRAHPIDERLAVAELETLFEALERPPGRAPATPSIVALEHLDRERWDRAIRSIVDLVGRGQARKIVAARSSVVTAATDLDAVDVLARLEDPRSPTTRFFVRRGRAALVGASPEHLFVQRGSRLGTEALAGSIASHAERGPERLLESAKDREEHELVVRHIVERLSGLCERVTRSDEPQIRRLPTVLHLRTPIEAELRRPTHPLEVLAALHPTPAVGGTPPDAALAWILAHEPAPRGWYGAPVGWVDARGDAEMIVALRCAVVQGGRAWVYAGSGIVAGSRPENEWDETTLKMRPMLRALGAVP